MKGRNSPHFLGVNITTDNIESGSFEQSMTFLELLFRGQNAASKQIFGLHIFWTKLQMQPMSFFTAALSHSENAQQILARRAIYVRQILICCSNQNFRVKFCAAVKAVNADAI